MRPIAMGRRSSSFSGSEGGVKSWAILASLVNTAKLHELDPQAYLIDVLERILSGQIKSISPAKAALCSLRGGLRI